MVNAERLHRLLLIGIIIGLAFSIYASIEVEYPAAQGVCSVNSYISCAAVDTSGHTSIGPVPDFVVGLAGFLLLLAFDLPLLRTYDVRYLYGVLGLATIGAVVAVGLGSIEVFVIHAVCPICLGAYLSDAFVLAMALWIWRLRRSRLPAEDPEPGAASA
jgi:uncharacterized membrane protein